MDDWALYDSSGDEPVMLEWGRESMTRQDLPKAKNPNLRASLAAMQRAAQMARNTAIQTNTDIVIVKDGQPVRITAEELRKAPRA